MEHFKNFLVRLQTFNIRMVQKMQPSYEPPFKRHEVTILDISHENPFLTPSFKSDLHELREQAVTDLLNLSPAQIALQMRRIENIKDLFKRFWTNNAKMNITADKAGLRDNYIVLDLDEIFIVPTSFQLAFGMVTGTFLDDLIDSVRARERYLKDFEKAVSKVLEGPIEQNAPVTTAIHVSGIPIINGDIIDALFSLLKDYFTPGEQEKVLDLLKSGKSLDSPFTFNGNGNQLADAFKQLFEANLVVGCKKSELEGWILRHFVYRDKVSIRRTTSMSGSIYFIGYFHLSGSISRN